MKDSSWSDERRAAHSERMKRCHAEGKHPGWSHKNQDPNRRSYPERWFCTAIENDEVLSKMIIVEQLKVNKYFLDLAFLEHMIDVEIDGCQHDRADVKAKDQVRDKFLIENGWKVYRISWDRVCQDPHTTFNDLKKFIASSDKSPYTLIKGKDKQVPFRRKRADQQMKLLIDAKIDFSKFGWVEKAALILGKRSTHINKWIKLWHNDFYEANCFKRKPMG